MEFVSTFWGVGVCEYDEEVETFSSRAKKVSPTVISFEKEARS